MRCNTNKVRSLAIEIRMHDFNLLAPCDDPEKSVRRGEGWGQTPTRP